MKKPYDGDEGYELAEIIEELNKENDIIKP